MVGNANTALTFHYERIRAVTAGMIEAAGSTFLLLIAVRWYEAGAAAKALVAAGGSVGLLLSPLVVSWVGSTGWTASKAASHLCLFGAGCLLAMALIPWQPLFVAGSVVAMASAAAAVPLMTQIYQENYPEEVRGRLFAKNFMVRIAAAAVFSEIAGRWLTGRLDRFPWLLLLFAGAFLVSSYCLSRCPSRPLVSSGTAHPMRSWHCVREDRLFRYTLVCWMLMGFANLMMFPLRVEYLANPKHGVALSVSQVALYAGVIPNLARLAMSPVWGHLFDRMNFFTLRIVLNAGFALGILAFFTSHTATGLVIGAIVFGIANAGGDVAWSLWVTKFSPPDRVADYMAVHTFFTGVRGVLAPLVAFHSLAYLSFATLGWISAGLIVAASLMLVPEIRAGPTLRSGTKVFEEVSE